MTKGVLAAEDSVAVGALRGNEVEHTAVIAGVTTAFTLNAHVPLNGAIFIIIKQ